MRGTSAERSGPREIPFSLSLLFIPVLLVAGLLSIPVGAVMVVYFRHSERRFVKTMRQEHRVMNEPDFAAVLQERRGTLIEEWFSNKGPVRYWWTSDDVPAASPFKWTASGVEASSEGNTMTSPCGCARHTLRTPTRNSFRAVTFPR